MPLNCFGLSDTRLTTGRVCPSLRKKLCVSTGLGTQPGSKHRARTTPVFSSVSGSVYSGLVSVGAEPSRV